MQPFTARLKECPIRRVPPPQAAEYRDNDRDSLSGFRTRVQFRSWVNIIARPALQAYFFVTPPVQACDPARETGGNAVFLADAFAFDDGVDEVGGGVVQDLSVAVGPADGNFGHFVVGSETEVQAQIIL